MAGKLAFGAFGFVLGVAATLVVTASLREDPPARAAPSRASVAAVPARPSPMRSAEPADETTAAPAADAPSLSDLPPERLAEEFLRRILATDGAELQRVLKDLVALGHERSRDVLLAIHSRIGDDAKRVQTTLAVAAQRGPFVLDVLDLLANERGYDARMQGLRRVREYALIDFEEHPEEYAAWRERIRGLSLREAALLSAREFAERLLTLRGKELETALDPFRGPAGHFPVLADSGLLPVFEKLLEVPLPENERSRAGPVTNLRRTAWTWIERMRPDEEFLRRVALPLARGQGAERPADSSRALAVLARSRLPWVFEELVDALRRARASGSYSFSLGGMFAEYGDRRAIPHLIAAIAADPKYETVYGLGYFGLGRLTGVRYDETHDGDWWLAWWDRNKDGLPAEVRAIDPRRLR
jgi:hypothetical protein